MEERVTALEKRAKAAEEREQALIERVAKLEAKPKVGRPPKEAQ